MIQYFSEDDNNDYYGFGEHKSAISQYKIESNEIFNNWISLTPNNMLGYTSDDKSFYVSSNKTTTHPIWEAFNHNDNYYADLGEIENNQIINVYFQFNNTFCIDGIRFKLHDILRPFKLIFSGSNDKTIWNNINEYIIGCSHNYDCTEWNNVVLYFDKSGINRYLKYSPTIVCKFDNHNKYKYYKLSFLGFDYYDIEVGLKISKMSLYEKYYTSSVLFHFPLVENSHDLTNTIIGTETNVNYIQNQAQFYQNSNIIYSPFFLNGFNDFSSTFCANISGQKCFGNIYSKENNFQFSYTQVLLGSQKILEFISLQDNSSFTINFNGYDYINQAEFFYSIDNGKKWKKFHVKNSENSQKIILNTNESLMIFNNNKYFWINHSYKYSLDLTGKFKVSGNIMSLVNFCEEIQSEYQFYRLFYDCKALIDAEKLILPAKKLKSYCYYQMFSKCSNLLKAPKILSIELSDYCCSYMFNECEKLQYVQSILLSEKLAPYCYSYMFKNCLLLKNAPQLPAITLSNSCYEGMFYHCISLQKSPFLPARKLVNYCYSHMFYNCLNLKKVFVQFEDNWNSSYTYYWLYGINSNGVLFKSEETPHPTNNYYGIPYSWQIQLIQNKIDYSTLNIEQDIYNFLQVQVGIIDKLGNKFSLSGKYYLKDKNTCDINCVYCCDDIKSYYEYQSIEKNINIKYYNGKWSFIDDDNNIYIISNDNFYNNPYNVKQWKVSDNYLSLSNYICINSNCLNNSIIFKLIIYNNNIESIYLSSIQSYKIKNQCHYYTLIIGAKEKSFYIDCEKIFSQSSEDTNCFQENGVFYLGNQNEQKINNDNKIKLKYLSFYNRVISENEIRKDMLK